MLLAVLAVVGGAVARLLWPAPGPAPRRPVARLGLLAAGAALLMLAAHVLSGTTSTAVAVAGYALLSAFGFANRSHPGMLLLSAGLLANSAVILANDGMPASGTPAGSASGDHRGLRPGDHLTALADTIPVLSERVSPGDVVVSLGGATAMFAWIPAGRVRRVA